MKILHIATHINIGGIGRYVTNLANALKKRGHAVFVASSGGELEKVLSVEGIRHIHLNIRTKSELSPRLISSYFTLRSFVKKEKIDLIHAHTRVTQVLAALLSASEKVPYVTTCHGFFKNRLGRRLYGCWGRKAVAISEAVKGQLTGDFNLAEEKVSLIHTGIELGRFTRDIPRGERDRLKLRWNISGAHIIGTVGRLSPVKGQEVLIKAAKRLIPEFKDIKVLLVGDGPDEKRLRRLSKELGLDENVIFTGSVEDTAEAITAMDVFVFPSIAEGLGLSLIEAMASGKACIASRVGGIASLVEEGVTGMLVEPDDAGDLARAIKYIFNNSEKAKPFKEGARKRAIQGFDIRDMASRMERMYEEVAGKSSRPKG